MMKISENACGKCCVVGPLGNLGSAMTATRRCGMLTNLDSLMLSSITGLNMYVSSEPMVLVA